MGVTFVTALILPSGPTYKPIDRYFSLFEQLVKTGIPIILYLDARLQSRGEILCSNYKNILQCTYSVIDTSQRALNIILPSVRDFEKDTADYMSIQLTKLRLMAEVATYTSGYLAWIDFGIYHMFKNTDLCNEWLKLIAKSGGFSTTRILSPGYKTIYTNLFEHICWRHCGSLLLGESTCFPPAYARQSELVREHMPYLTWEVNYWAMMMDHFQIYIAMHDDSILEGLLDHTI